MAMPSRRNRQQNRPPTETHEHPIAALQDRMNRAFDSFFSSGPWRSGFDDPFFGGLISRNGGFRPTVDVSENDGSITVTAELPGLTEDDVEVTLNENVLTLSGEKRQESEEEREDFRHVERSYGSFRRSFTLPNTIDPERVTAKFNKGVLTVNIARNDKAIANERRISVQSGE